MTSLLQILLMILNIAQWIILAHIIMSWLINFQVLNLRQPLVAQIWYGLNRLLDPVYSAKGAVGLIDLIRKGTFRSDERVVFLHTGGAIGLTGYTHAFDVKGRV